jgi:hypothetical protein
MRGRGASPCHTPDVPAAGDSAPGGGCAVTGSLCALGEFVSQ